MLKMNIMGHIIIIIEENVKNEKIMLGTKRKRTRKKEEEKI